MTNAGMKWEMHEFSVMSQMVELILAEAKKREAECIEQVNLEVGEFTFLAEEQLRFTYEILTKGTIGENSNLVITSVKGKIRCDCGYEGGPELPEEIHMLFPILKCPKCGKIAQVKEGLGCTIRNITMVVPDVQT